MTEEEIYDLALRFNEELEFDTVEICRQCGEEDLCDFVRDPYLEESCPERDNPRDWRCRACFENRVKEIAA